MILRALGCSGSVVPGEHHQSFLVGDSVLLDMGSAASLLTLEEQARVTDIFLTHAHLDHVKDIGFFAENVRARGGDPIRVRGSAETIDHVRAHLLNDVIWPDFSRIPSAEAPVLAWRPFAQSDEIDLGDLRVRPIPVPHMAGSVGYFLTSGSGAIFYSGDTGPADDLWVRMNALGGSLMAILFEVSFPDRLEWLAAASRHHTPRLLAAGLARLHHKDVPVHVHHLKAPTRSETVEDLERLGDERIRLLSPGDTISF